MDATWKQLFWVIIWTLVISAYYSPSNDHCWSKIIAIDLRKLVVHNYIIHCISSMHSRLKYSHDNIKQYISIPLHLGNEYKSIIMSGWMTLDNCIWPNNIENYWAMGTLPLFQHVYYRKLYQNQPSFLKLTFVILIHTPLKAMEQFQGNFHRILPFFCSVTLSCMICCIQLKRPVKGLLNIMDQAIILWH